MTGIYTKSASKLLPDFSVLQIYFYFLQADFRLFLGRLIFFGSAIVSSLLMVHLGYNWKKLNKEFAVMESKFSKFGYPERIGVKFKVFTFAFLIFGLGRVNFHYFSICNG